MRRTTRLVLVLGLASALALALVISGCGGSTTSGGTSGGSSTGSSGSSGGGAGTVSVSLQNFAFNPSNVTAKVGDTVTFVNNDSVQHHIFVGSTDMGVQDPGATVTFTADKAGTYPLKCIIHPSMTGSLTVQ